MYPIVVAADVREHRLPDAIVLRMYPVVAAGLVLAGVLSVLLGVGHGGLIAAGMDVARHAECVSEFVAAATGGPSPWQGRDLTTAHRHLNVTGATPEAVRATALQAAAFLGIEAF